jgi:hypothetical protein
MSRTDLINGRAELLLRPDLETTRAAMWFLSRAPASLWSLAENGQSGSFALPFRR